MNVILFDGDGTLIDSTSSERFFHEYIFAKFFEDIPLDEGVARLRRLTMEELYSLSPSPEFLNFSVGALDFFYHRSIQSYINTENSLKLKHRIVAKFLHEYDKEYDYPTAEKLIQTMEEEWFRFYRPFPGVLGMLSRLKKNGMTCIGVSNGFSLLQNRKFKQCKLDGFLDKIVISEEVGVGKPSPEVFKKALEGQVASPKNIMMVGDKEEKDLAPAREMGLRTFLWEGAGSADELWRMINER